MIEQLGVGPHGATGPRTYSAGSSATPGRLMELSARHGPPERGMQGRPIVQAMLQRWREPCMPTSDS